MNNLNIFTTRIRSLLGGFFGVTPETESAKVSQRRAMEYAPVFYAVNKIAGHFSQLPINCFRRLERGSELASKHAGHKLVHFKPNDYQTAPEWKMQGAVHLLLWGNWRCAVERKNGVPTKLVPFQADRSASIFVDGQRWHGTVVGKHEPLAKVLGVTEESQTVWVPDSSMFFVHGVSFDSLQGLDPTALMSNSLDAGLSAEEQVRTLAKKGFSGSLILEAPAGMFRNEEEAKRFLNMFRESHDGSENTGKTGMLREGIKANVVTMSGRDSQWIEQRLFQRQEAAMWFLLEEILGDDSSVSYNSLAEKHMAYLTNCLNKWLVHIEAACERSLLTETQKDKASHFFKFNTNAMMRMDPMKQAEYLSQLIMARVINPNEAREKLDMNPYDGGDEYYNPAITPGEASNESQDDESDTEPAPDVADQTRAAFVSRLRHMLSIEQKRVTQAAATKNFVASIDRFYEKSNWQNSLAEVCEELGGSADDAAAHCEESKSMLIELLQTTDKDGLSDAVGELTASWPERAELIAERLLGAIV